MGLWQKAVAKGQASHVYHNISIPYLIYKVPNILKPINSNTYIWNTKVEGPRSPVNREYINKHACWDWSLHVYFTSPSGLHI